MIVLLLGTPGSGTTTQARFLEKKLNFFRVYFGRSILEKMRIGEIKETREWIIKRMRKKGNYVLDNIIRTLEQAEDYYKKFKIDIVFFFNNVNEKEAEKRLLNRIFCSECNAVYTKRADFPEIIPRFIDKHPICSCGGYLVQKPIDKEDAIRERLKENRIQINHLVQFYQERTEFIKIDASKSPTNVFNQIKDGLEKISYEFLDLKKYL